MHVTYKPEDGTSTEWDFDAGRVRASTAEVIEKRYGENWESWVAGVSSGNIRARRVLLWHLLTRDHPTLRYEDTPDFFADELLVQFSSAELAALRERVSKADIAAERRESMLAAIDLETAEAVKREAESGSGKAS